MSSALLITLVNKVSRDLFFNFVVDASLELLAKIGVDMLAFPYMQAK
jgi:hypothetical protein